MAKTANSGMKGGKVVATIEAQEQARKIINRFMDTISEGEGDYSCNECELDTYLCPHLFTRLQGMVAEALEANGQRSASVAALSTTTR
jgi:hypothetical protein